MGNQSSKPSSEQVISKTEPNQASSTSSASGSSGAAVGARREKNRSILCEDFDNYRVVGGVGVALGPAGTVYKTYGPRQLLVGDESGIPLRDTTGGWQTTSVTETHTENHFNLNPLIRAYRDYYIYHVDRYNRSWQQSYACWIKVIGTLQRLLPIHILQRFCDPGTPFSSASWFTGVFKRTTQVLKYDYSGRESLLSSSLSTDFSLYARDSLDEQVRSWPGSIPSAAGADFYLAAVRRINQVSTSEIETKIKQLLTVSAQSQTKFRL